jgi:dephospho-CoA kinase
MAKIILGLTGEMGSGKGTIAKYIIEQKQGSSHRFSTMLRDVLNRLFVEQSRDNLQHISTILRQTFGEDILAKVMFHEVQNDQHDIVVIDGIRRMSDIAFLTQIPEFKLVYTEADMKARFDRISVRGENSDDGKKTFEQFAESHKNEAESQILALRDHANVIIDNNGNLQDLYKTIDQLIAEQK